MGTATLFERKHISDYPQASEIIKDLCEKVSSPEKTIRFDDLEVVVGPSTQSTLLGRQHTTVESLYLSPVLLDRLGGVPKVFDEEPGLFAAL